MGEVIDHGGTWTADEADDEHGRGLTIVAAVAGDGNWGIDGGAASRAAWFRLDWHPNVEERDPSSAGGKLLPRTVSLGICTRPGLSHGLTCGTGCLRVTVRGRSSPGLMAR